MNSKSYINVNGKKVEDKDVKMVLNKGIMNVDIDDNGKKKHYHVNLNKKMLHELEMSSYNLEDRLKRDFMREKQEQLNFSPHPFQKMEIIILPKNNFKPLKNSNKSYEFIQGSDISNELKYTPSRRPISNLRSYKRKINKRKTNKRKIKKNKSKKAKKI
jgi:hypothetical protein